MWPKDKKKTPPMDVTLATEEQILSECVEEELDVSRLGTIHKQLWLAGRAGNIRSLHRQKILGREIVITEDTNLHLVWDQTRIFIKPLPKFLLDYSFFKRNLCSDEDLHKKACGLLSTYTKLILHESDFIMAIEMNLLPSTLKDKYNGWCEFAVKLRSNIHQDSVDERYIYGELRMTRLNLIYRVLGYGARGFHSNYNRYGFFFQRNFGGLLIGFGYISLVLAAMQTVLSSPFGESQYMKGTSYGFGIFSYVTIMVVLGVVLLIFFMFVVLFASNLLVTLRHDRERKCKPAEVDLEADGGGSRA